MRCSLEHDLVRVSKWNILTSLRGWPCIKPLNEIGPLVNTVSVPSVDSWELNVYLDFSTVWIDTLVSGLR